jgi:hypothetical protein
MSLEKVEARVNSKAFSKFSTAFLFSNPQLPPPRHSCLQVQPGVAATQALDCCLPPPSLAYEFKS